jgi:mycothiol synthase
VSDVEVRELVAVDAEGIAGAVRAGRERGEFRASSDAEGTFVLKAFEVNPVLFGGAFAAGELIGLVSSEFKFALVASPFRRRGIGRRLIELAERMERQRGRPNVLMGCLPDDGVAAAFLGATGFAFHSTLWDLGLDPATEIGPVAWPEGLDARDFDRTRDVGAWVALFNLAFTEHATPLQLDASFIAAGMNDPSVEDADTIVVEDPATGELVGFCATAPTRTDGAIGEKGEIWTIGVRPERQGRGLGRQLLRAGVARLRSLGIREIDLSVNARNERALRLYEEEGFVRTRTRERWARPVPPAYPPPEATRT